jgi:hypothetical protein
MRGFCLRRFHWSAAFSTHFLPRCALWATVGLCSRSYRPSHLRRALSTNCGAISSLSASSIFVSRRAFGSREQTCSATPSRARFRPGKAPYGAGSTKAQPRRFLDQGLAGWAMLVRRVVYFNCWHIADHESDHMWAKYSGGKGVALRSSLSRLRSSIRDSESQYVLGEVAYTDFATGVAIWEGSAFAPF